ncbi:hypothetical protein [Holdemanella biformis]|uniref:hypothetical protein n=1 Tax=Holdemanella biformis TaxID=1735 RepID=UPI002E77C001|nr:hypothetical protein [Holdemanella biformis]
MNKKIMGYFKSIQTFIRSLFFEPLITEVTRFLGTGFYRNLSYQAIPAVPAVLFVFS